MADRPIIMPRIWRRRGNNRQEMLGGEFGLPDGGNSFTKRSLVVLTSGNLIAVATAGVLVLGQTPDDSHLSTDRPPVAFHGENHWPFDLRDNQILMNLGHANGTDVHIGAAGSAKQLSDVTVGTSYGILRPTTGTYAGYQFVDPTNTSTTLVTVVAKPTIIDGEGQVAATYNALVLVEIIPTKIQSVA